MRLDLESTITDIMKYVLDIGQSSLQEHQFEAFRRLIMDYISDVKKSLGLGKDRCGNKQNNGKEGGVMSE